MDLVTGEQKASIDPLINSPIHGYACVCVRVCVPDLTLLLGPLQDPLLDGALADEAVDGDLLGLTQPVGPVHGLLVHRGVPVAVVEDDLEGKAQRGQRAAADGDGPRRFLPPLTVSAAVRLMPSPPARVLSRKTKMSVLQRREDGGRFTRVKRIRVRSRVKSRSKQTRPRLPQPVSSLRGEGNETLQRKFYSKED